MGDGVTLLFGNRDGSFSVGPSYATLSTYNRVAAADFDGNGSPDLLVSDGRVGALLLNSCGMFALTAVTPPYGSSLGRQSVTITGTNLAGANAVFFGGKRATIRRVTATAVTAETPAHPSGMVDVVVVTPTGNVTLPSAFLFVGGAPGASSIPLLPPWAYAAFAVVAMLVAIVALRSE